MHFQKGCFIQAAFFLIILCLYDGKDKHQSYKEKDTDSHHTGTHVSGDRFKQAKTECPAGSGQFFHHIKKTEK